jgi:aminoglycoside 2'-N-acetyltransferase I
MTATVTLDLKADLDPAARAQNVALAAAVYPPETVADWPGHHLEWSDVTHCARVFDETGLLVSYAGVLVHDGALDGRPVRIGGIGGVKTHPDHRRRGLAALAMGRAVAWFRERGDVDFALLVCESRLLGTYGRLGWSEFGGTLRTLQRGVPEVFTFNRVMTHSVRSEAPDAGLVDLAGPPW